MALQALAKALSWNALTACATGMCYRPECFEGSQITTASLRDKLADAHEGTAVIDEAHGEKSALEGFLLLRDRRDTAVVNKQDTDERGRWENRSFPIFGPTILARRTPMADGALESRSIIVKTRPASRPPMKPSQGQLPGAMESFRTYAAGFPQLPDCLDIPGTDRISPRILDTYEVILQVSRAAGDEEFVGWLLDRMESDTAALSETQIYEEHALVLQAVLAHSNKEGESSLYLELLTMRNVSSGPSNH